MRDAPPPVSTLTAELPKEMQTALLAKATKAAMQAADVDRIGWRQV